MPVGDTIEGFGASVTGGAGGTTIHVTNLNDSGAGSYRAALLSQVGARIIVFDVSGTITLSSPIELRNDEDGSGSPDPGKIYDDLTIDGSSAPNQGIQIAGEPTIIRCDNVLIKYMRFRIGDRGVPAGRDGLAFDTSTNCAAVHCSVECGDDGDLDITNSSTGITVQYCLIGANLSSGSMLIKYGTTITASIHHNVFFNSGRKPECGGPTQIDWVNNVMHRNYGPDALSLWPPDEGVIQANIVKNYLKYGSSAGNNENSRPIYFYADRTYSATSSFYAAGNALYDSVGTLITDTQNQIYGNDAVTMNGSPFNYPAITTVDPSVAYTDLMANAGAILPCRDALDTTILGHIAAGTGKTSGYSDISELGGYPDLTQPCGSSASVRLAYRLG